jgi:hypothetical protein
VPYLAITHDWIIWIIYFVDVNFWRMQLEILECNGIAAPFLITISKELQAPEVDVHDLDDPDDPIVCDGKIRHIR